MENCELWSCVTGFSCEDKKGNLLLMKVFLEVWLGLLIVLHSKIMAKK